MFEKINILSVFAEHISTLKKYGSDKYSISDIIIFLVSPAILAFILLFACNIPLKGNLIMILVTSFSIFAALLFNLLLLIYDIVSKHNKNGWGISDKTKKNRKLTLKEKLLKETYVNISFNITISVISIILLIALYFITETVSLETYKINIYSLVLNPFQYLISLFSFAVYYFLIQFMLTLLMIIKRINILLSKEFE